jgi:hypothetical protein
MKKRAILLMAMLVASVAFSQMDYYPNMMCVVFDTETMEPCLDGLAPNTFVTA